MKSVWLVWSNYDFEKNLSCVCATEEEVIKHKGDSIYMSVECWVVHPMQGEKNKGV